ncbi:phosphatidylethanolamine:Kdo2-lipid A phosphoethanolamine transferase [Duganella sp. CF458]|uniref:phosphoethanolamine transferase n=1 Tax=Duganella sp. CF458 TaxID=1884368 RepID=UPI0008E3E8E4|nr:phosphoethanolamine--lipid A transferase [Duganella sp. CF458]SFH02202.1 phosphatidylethanolamine:Kdo2-lipid A phosphoethanolamine transferase [Duganella sp. CF458]
MKLPRIPSAGLPLVGASFLVLIYNISFWKGFVSATGGLRMANLLVYLGTALLLVLIFSGVLALVNFRRLFKPVVIALLLLSSMTAYFMSQYGIVVDASMVQNVVETDVREAGELFSWKLVQSVLLFGALPSWLVWRLPVRYGSLRRELLANIGVVAGSLLLATGLLLVLFKTLAPAIREHRELRFTLTPTNVFQAANGYLKHKWATPTVIAPLGTDATKGSLWAAAGSGQHTVTVIVVGETARAMNFSLNGYGRATNPRLAQVQSLVNFNNVSSCGTATAVSVPCVFSGLTRDNYSEVKARSKEGLLDVLQHAGLEVIWRDNNSGCKGVCDRVRYEDMSQPVAGNPLCSAEECYDEHLLEGLPELIRNASKDLVIVLHQKGSHGPAYWKRYPAEFRKFGPVCQTNELEQCSRESITAAYDNTILYTDYFLDKTIRLLKEAGVPASMLYFSDHGESLGEKNMYLHGAPYIFSPEEQRKVPMMLWMSDSFSQRFHVDRSCLAARSSQQFSHDNVFHSTLGMLNVNTAVYNPKLDLFHACNDDA